MGMGDIDSPMKVVTGQLDGSGRWSYVSPGGGGGGGGDASAANQTTEIARLTSLLANSPALVGGAIPVTSTPDLTSNTTLGALNAALTAAPAGRDTMNIQVSGTYVGTISVQGSLDGTNYISLGGAAVINLATGAGTGTIPANAIGLYQVGIGGFVSVKVIMSAYTSGTATVYANLTSNNSIVGLDTPLPAGTNTIGTVLIGALSAGAASIGTVGLNAGANTIGNVGLVAGAASIGSVTLNAGSNLIGGVNNSQVGGVAISTGSGINGTGVQRVSLPTDQTVIPTNLQLAGVNVAAGSGVTGTGVLRVVLATDVALPAGTNAIGTVVANLSIGGTAVASNIGSATAQTVRTIAAASNNPTTAQVASSATVVTLIGAGATTQMGRSIYNASTAILYIKFGTAASLTDFTLAMAPSSFFECPNNYVGIITGIWATANGFAYTTVWSA